MSDTVHSQRVTCVIQWGVEVSPTQLFGRYELHELIGQGGMGEVYRAFDPKHGRTVALKRLLRALSGDPDLVKRFMLECRAAASLNDPHVIPIHDSGEIDGQLYIDMRYIEGTDLEKIIKRDGSIAPRRTATLIHQAAEALDAAHAENLIHRDVKPSNLLVARHGFIYLIDFGIVHVLGAPTTVNARTQVGSVIGTFHYMAPERFTDPDRTDPRVDVYSLACVLYECLTGQRPFPLSDRFAVAHAHMELPPPRVSDQRPELASFDRIVARGMAKDPDERYRSAGDLATEIDAVAATLGRPLPGRQGWPSIDPTGPTRQPVSPTGRAMAPPEPVRPPTVAPTPHPPPTVIPAAPPTGHRDPYGGTATRAPIPPEPTRLGPTPLPRQGPPGGPNATRPEPPPPTRLLPPATAAGGFDDVVPPDPPNDADRPRRWKRASILVAAGVVLVVLMVALGEMLSRDATIADPPGGGETSESATTTPPSTERSSTAPATGSASSTRSTTEGDLGIAGVPISVLPCDGRWITNIGSAAPAGHAWNSRVFLGPFDSER